MSDKKLKLYGAIASPFVRVVRFALLSSKTEFDYQELDLFKGEHKSPEYLKVNPRGQVPAIDDNGFCLFESHAIIRYVGNKSNSSVYPTDLKARALVDEALELLRSLVVPALTAIIFNSVFAHFFGAPSDANAIAKGRTDLATALTFISNNYFQQSENHLLGKSVTLADAAFSSYLSQLQFVEFDLSAFPKIQNYLKAISATDDYKTAHQNYDGTVAFVKEKLAEKLAGK